MTSLAAAIKKDWTARFRLLTFGMSDIQTCLSVFAVVSCAYDGANLDHVDKVIDDYLAVFNKSDRRSALAALKTAFRNLRLDSQVAYEIGDRIDDRINALSKSKRGDDKDGGNSAPLA